MFKNFNLFKVGYLASTIMLIGIISNGNFPTILIKVSEINILLASLIYLVANFVIFTFPAFLVYKSTKIISKTHEFKWKSIDGKFINMFRFIKHLVKLCINFFPVAFVFLVIYMITALVRGDVSIENVVLTDYGYFVGVIITALFFGFRDSSENNRNIETINQKQNELKELQSII